MTTHKAILALMVVFILPFSCKKQNIGNDSSNPMKYQDSVKIVSENHLDKNETEEGNPNKGWELKSKLNLKDEAPDSLRQNKDVQHIESDVIKDTAVKENKLSEWVVSYGTNTPGKANSSTYFIGKKVIVDESIKTLGPESEHFLSTRNNRFTILSYYDGNCSICYSKLPKWNELIEEFKNLNVSFKFIFSSQNESILRFNLDQIDFSADLSYYDSKNKFVDKYGYLKQKKDENVSMLLNEDNIIIFVGNPSLSSEQKMKFIELIRK